MSAGAITLEVFLPANRAEPPRAVRTLVESNLIRCAGMARVLTEPTRNRSGSWLR